MRPEEPVLPNETTDETDLGWGDEPDDADERIRDEVPPHHLDSD